MTVYRSFVLNIFLASDPVWDTLYSENSTTTLLGGDSLNGIPHLWNRTWVPGTKIRIEWGSNDYIEFVPQSDIFVDRIATNQIISLTDLSTSDDNLASWVQNAAGAVFCISYDKGWDSAWGIKDKNDNSFGIGCNSGSWQGRGAFYGNNDNNEGGWTGVTDNGQPKGGNNLGITIKLESVGKYLRIA